MRLTLDGAFAVGRIPLPLDGTFAVGFAFWLLDPKFVFELVRATRPFVRIEEKDTFIFLDNIQNVPSPFNPDLPRFEMGRSGLSGLGAFCMLSRNMDVYFHRCEQMVVSLLPAQKQIWDPSTKMRIQRQRYHPTACNVLSSGILMQRAC